MSGTTLDMLAGLPGVTTRVPRFTPTVVAPTVQPITPAGVLAINPLGMGGLDLGSGGASGSVSEPGNGSLGPAPGVTGIDLGFSPMGVANDVAGLAGQIGSAIGGPGLGGHIGTAIGGGLVTGMAAGMANNGLSAMGAPNISGVSAVANTVTGGLIGQSIAQQVAAAFSPMIGPPVPAEIAMAALTPAMMANTDFTGTGSASKGVGLNGEGLMGGDKVDAGMGFGGSVSGDGLGDGGGKAGGSMGGEKGDVGEGVGSEGGQTGGEKGEGEGNGGGANLWTGGFTGYGSDGVLQPRRRVGNVHEGEIIVPANVVSAIGVENLMPLTNLSTAPNRLAQLVGMRRAEAAAPAIFGPWAGAAANAASCAAPASAASGVSRPPLDVDAEVGRSFGLLGRLTPLDLGIAGRGGEYPADPSLTLSDSGRAPGRGLSAEEVAALPRGGFIPDLDRVPRERVMAASDGGASYWPAGGIPDQLPGLPPSRPASRPASAQGRGSGEAPSADLLNSMSLALARREDFGGIEGPQQGNALARLVAAYRGER